ARQKFDPSQLEFIDKNLTDRAVKFMETNAKEKKQFFAFLPYASTHFPTMVHSDFQGRSVNGPWADMLTQIDAYTGRLLDSINDLGIRDNTVFIADNGPEMAHGNNILSLETTSQGGPGPWRGDFVRQLRGKFARSFCHSLAQQNPCWQIE
ncbi:MAG: sulfatase-like hydrolase/transferase, partial [Akkermansiaceae bacterium]